MTERHDIDELTRINAAQTDLIIRQAAELDRLREELAVLRKRRKGLMVLAGLAD
ncbi:MAG: hypothetical protein KIT02_02145 [Devosia sp.]|uniref:hypothetical protein n=1 Tax=Devosia sp. TaxID=1871048 RepID=UPI0024C97506|nr:hypothetical protein [Devosia sp.]UYO00057.1 MAG: hypothetical protein KIT02_02145 [Devosia sp.]